MSQILARCDFFLWIATTGCQVARFDPSPKKLQETLKVTTRHNLPMSLSKKCGACSKTIYPNDPKLSMGDHTYHKSCSKCDVCKGQLNIKNFATSGGRLPCKTHFMVRSFLSSLLVSLLNGWQQSLGGAFIFLFESCCFFLVC